MYFSLYFLGLCLQLQECYRNVFFIVCLYEYERANMKNKVNIENYLFWFIYFLFEKGNNDFFMIMYFLQEFSIR